MHADTVHDFIINKVVQSSINGLPVEYKEYTPPCPVSTIETHAEIKVENIEKPKREQKAGANTKKAKAKKKEKSSKSSKKSSQKTKGKKEKDAGPAKIDVPGEIFFTDPNLSVYRLQNTNTSVTDGYAISSIVNMMTKAQKYDLNPIVIKIKKMCNIPVDILQKQG